MGPTITLLLALTCNPATVQAKLVESNALMAQIKEEDWEIQDHTARIAQIQRAMAAERSNPSGIVDLRMLHDLGTDLQSERHALAEVQALEKVDVARMRKVLAEEEAAIKACKR
jgi:hypothetical protein